MVTIAVVIKGKKLAFKAVGVPSECAALILNGLDKKVLTKKRVQEQDLYGTQLTKSLRYGAGLAIAGSAIDIKYSKNTKELTAAAICGMC